MYWCLGMFGSASTWTFNVVVQLLAALHPDRAVAGCFVAEPSQYPAGEPDLRVVKTHAPPNAAVLAQSARAIVITVRDPRDAVASMMAHSHWPFDYALYSIIATAHLCEVYARDGRACLLRFEDRFFERPDSLDQLARALGGSLPAPVRDSIFAANRREAVENFIAGLGDLATAETRYDPLSRRTDTYDTVTRWHRHHAGRQGTVGRWRRELEPAQVAQIEAKMLPWMERFGYLSAEEEDFTASLGLVRNASG